MPSIRRLYLKLYIIVYEELYEYDEGKDTKYDFYNVLFCLWTALTWHLLIVGDTLLNNDIEKYTRLHSLSKCICIPSKYERKLVLIISANAFNIRMRKSLALPLPIHKASYLPSLSIKRNVIVFYNV